MDWTNSVFITSYCKYRVAPVDTLDFKSLMYFISNVKSYFYRFRIAFEYPISIKKCLFLIQ